jgi:hypothetical protein
MNLRAVGCAVIGVAAFVGLGLWGLSLAFQDASGCPPTLQWADRAYVGAGTPAPSPDLGSGEPVYIGSTFMGPLTRRAYGPAGSSPSTDAAARPERIALECGDGTFQTYRWAAATPSGSALP